MSHKLYKILLILGIIAVLVAIPAFWLTFSAATDLEVVFLDVGQGDSILIKTPFGQNILIDGGPDDITIKRLSENLAWWDRRIDLMILSHPHSDHVGGLIDVINRYKVAKIIYTGVVHNSPDYLFWLEKIRDRRQGGAGSKIPLTIIDRPQTIKLGEDLELQIIYPFKSLLAKEVDNLNSSSLAVKLVYGKTKFLFLGDAEVEVEKELLESGINLSANVLKASHHGSDTSNSQEFLNVVNPEIVVIPVGEDNDFGHPSRRVIKRLERIGAEVFRTDVDGTVKIISNGNDLNIIK